LQERRGVSNLLNFNINRELGFTSARTLLFDSNRELTFDPNRELNFSPNRDLGFGKHGVLFRGYVCAACNAIVAPDATSCDECGAVFEEPEARGIMKARPSVFAPTAESRAAPPPPPSPRAPPPPPSLPRPEPASEPTQEPYMERPAPPRSAAPIPPPPPSHIGPPPPAAGAAHFCHNCGARSWAGDAFCWNCGARFTTGAQPATAEPGAQGASPPPTETIQLPPRKAKKVVKDWTETGKSLSEYAEEEK